MGGLIAGPFLFEGVDTLDQTPFAIRRTEEIEEDYPGELDYT